MAGLLKGLEVGDDDVFQTVYRRYGHANYYNVFGTEGGYVLDFSNRTFAEFCREELGIDIYDSRWSVDGGSKAKRLRCFLRQADRRPARRALLALWQYCEIITVASDYPPVSDNVRDAFFRTIASLFNDNHFFRVRVA